MRPDIAADACKFHQFGTFLVTFSFGPAEGGHTQHAGEQSTVQPQVCTDHHIFEGTHVHAHLYILERSAHATARQLVRTLVGDVLAVQQDLAFAWRADSADQVKQCGLAGAVGADHGVDRSLLDRKGDALHCLDAAERLGDLVDDKHQLSPRLNRRRNVGTSPLGKKIIVTIKMTPKTTVSHPSNADNSCGSMVRITAPRMEPNTEAMPPTMTMVTSSMEWKKPATLGVTKPT